MSRPGAVYLLASVNGVERRCLLDTGSDVTLIPSDVVDCILVRPTLETLKAANGTIIPVIGETTINVKIGDATTTTTGLVSEHVGEIMLGIDWLTNNSIGWNFASSSITYNGQTFKLSSSGLHERRCCRIVVQSDVSVPPRSQMNVQTKVVFNCRPHDIKGECVGTDPTTVAPGVYCARVLLPADRYNDVPVRLVNVNVDPVVLKSGTFVSNVEAVTVEEAGDDVNGASTVDYRKITRALHSLG